MFEFIKIGTIYHRIGSILPTEGNAKFSQIYLYDNQTQTEIRRGLLDNLNERTLDTLTNSINVSHPLATFFQNNKGRILNEDIKIIIREKPQNVEGHERTYNRPIVNEVAAIYPSTYNLECSTRDIVMYKEDGRLLRISEFHRMYDSMSYPILFPYGDNGFHFGLKHVDEDEEYIINSIIIIGKLTKTYLFKIFTVII